MLRLASVRLALSVPIMAIVATMTYFLVELVPGDPAAFLLGSGATSKQVSDLHHELGLDRPLIDRFLSWFGDLLHGDLGTSFVTNESTLTSLSRAMPVTVSVALLATIFTLVVGVTLGMLAAVRGGVADAFVQWFGSISMSIPNFWLAAVLVLIFAIKVPVLPATGYVPVASSPTDWFAHLILPTIAVGLAGVGQVAFQTRDAVADQLSREYVRTLIAAGLPRWRILGKHVLRNASGPIVTVASIGFVFALGAVVVVESIFGLPGVGTLMLTAVRIHDLPLVQGAVLMFCLVVVVANLVTDLIVAALNPRVRLT
ncbi:ABC transporter permease [Nocardioides immobilis]|uniref:ABC transporter permease n=1 Tax=Nocardioides immobilis TaxID=2049295 RepID=A0A417XUR2_9ACTN|nr:ABC transporter permease [Nocardioides immobilis]RHW24086.1 ABC transporter permease [Nocardioides immobilis]